MITMKKRAAIAVTVGVWVAGLGCAAALAYELNRPLLPATAMSEIVAAAPVEVVPATVAEPASEARPILYVGTTTLVARAPHRTVTPVVLADPKAREISEMRCNDWRELDIGSGHVQVCE